MNTGNMGWTIRVLQKMAKDSRACRELVEGLCSVDMIFGNERKKKSRRRRICIHATSQLPFHGNMYEFMCCLSMPGYKTVKSFLSMSSSISFPINLTDCYNVPFLLFS